MTHEDKIQYMKFAAGICNYGFSTEQLDLMVSLYELILEKKGGTDLRSVFEVQAATKARADAKKKSELLDKVSDKI